MYSFDTGSGGALLTEVAQGYIELLSPLLLANNSEAGPRGPYLQTLKQLPWDPDDRYLEDRASAILGLLPAVYVVVAEARVTGHAPNVIEWLVSVRVHAASGWEGQLVNGRLNADVDDSRLDPGVFVIAQHAIEQLHHRDLPTSPQSGSIQVRSLEHLATGADVTVWTIETQVPVRQQVCLQRDAPPLEQIDTNHGVKRKGVIARQRKALF